MGSLQEFKERVNKNSKVNIPLEDANKFISEFLSNPYLEFAYTNFGIKLRLLHCLKVSVSDVLKISPEQISYIVKPAQSNSMLAGLRRIKGDGSYIIEINETRVKNLPPRQFCTSILHEFGHISLVEAAINGKFVPESIYVDSRELDGDTEWQQLGADLKYRACKNEALAQRFARRMEKEYLSRSGRFLDRFGVSVAQLSNKFNCSAEFVNNQISAIRLWWWKKLSDIKQIPESDAVTYEPVTAGVASIVQQLDRIAEKITKIRSTPAAYGFITAVEQKIKEEKLNVDDSFSYKLELMNAYMYLLAENLGCSREEVGFMNYPDLSSVVEIVEPCEYDKNCPLKAYVLVDQDAFNDMGPTEFSITITEKFSKLISPAREPENNSWA